MIHKNALSIQAIPTRKKNAYKTFCTGVNDGNVYVWVQKGKRIKHKSPKYAGFVDIREGSGGILLATISADKPDLSLGNFVSRITAWLGDQLLSINIQRQ